MHKGKTKSHVLEGFLKAEHTTKNRRFWSLTQPAGLGLKLSEPWISYLKKKKKRERGKNWLLHEAENKISGLWLIFKSVVLSCLHKGGNSDSDP